MLSPQEEKTPGLSTSTSLVSSRPWSMRSEILGSAGDVRHEESTGGVDGAGESTVVSVSPLVGAPVGFFLDGATTNVKIDEILKNQLQPEEEQNCAPSTVYKQQPRSGRYKRRAVLLGRVRRLLSHPRAASRPESVKPHLAPSDAGNTVQDKATSRRLFHPDGLQSRSWPRSRRGFTSPAPVRRAASARPPAPAEVRPRPDRVENFHHALDNEVVHQAFGEFCRRTLSSENVEFVRQVRDLDGLSSAKGTTAKQLRDKLCFIADTFLGTESDTEVNVRGSFREDALCAIEAALDASKNNCRGDGRGEGPWAWVLATAATDALVHLARDVHPLILDGLWPRFLVSDEFKRMMNTKEMRTTGFTDLDGRIIVNSEPSHRSHKAWTMKRELASAFSWRASRDISEAFPERSESTSTCGGLDAMEAAQASSDLTSTTQPPVTRRRCVSSFRGPAVFYGRQQQQEQQQQEQQRAAARVGRGGNAFGGLPNWSGAGSMKKDTDRPSSAINSPTRCIRGIRQSASRRALSWR